MVGAFIFIIPFSFFYNLQHRKLISKFPACSLNSRRSRKSVPPPSQYAAKMAASPYGMHAGTHTITIPALP